MTHHQDPASPVLTPAALRPGDRVRFVSPASPPDRAGVERRAGILEGWGLQVEVGRHAFDQRGFLAGRDEDRLADLNKAFRDPEIRAVFATRGGKGSYRIADRLDFDAVRADPKILVGFSDITVLHLSLWKHCRLIGLHGGLFGPEDVIAPETEAALRSALMTREHICLQADATESTARLTTEGQAKGRLIGGNLIMLATAAGWALPDLTGAILLVEAVDLAHGAIDRTWSMMTKSGCLEGLAGIAFGQFTGIRSEGAWTAFDYLREHLAALGVPVLGGLPLGHGPRPRAVPIGAWADLDADAGTLRVVWDCAGDN